MGTIQKSKKAAKPTATVKPAAKTAKAPAASRPAPAPVTRTSAPRSNGNGNGKRAAAPTREAIALRAYYIAEQRQREGLPGCPESDWLQAERMVAAGIA